MTQKTEVLLASKIEPCDVSALVSVGVFVPVGVGVLVSAGVRVPVGVLVTVDRRQ